MKMSKVFFKAVNLEVGEFYDVIDSNDNVLKKCLFIKSTEKGFNFVDFENNKLVSSKPIYTTKNNKAKFWLHIQWRVKKSNIEIEEKIEEVFMNTRQKICSFIRKHKIL